MALIRYSVRAERQIDALRGHYEDLGRTAAIRNLFDAMDEAERQILENPGAGIPAPRPYPGVARPGLKWVKAKRYWFNDTASPPHMIVAVFYDTADILNRL